MDDKFQDIVDSLPEKPARSRLEPYNELIDELRRRGRTYREIAHILAEKCQLIAGASTIHDFVRVRSLKTRKPAKRQRTAGPAVDLAGLVSGVRGMNAAREKEMPTEE